MHVTTFTGAFTSCDAVTVFTPLPLAFCASTAEAIVRWTSSEPAFRFLPRDCSRCIPRSVPALRRRITPAARRLFRTAIAGNDYDPVAFPCSRQTEVCWDPVLAGKPVAGLLPPRACLLRQSARLAARVAHSLSDLAACREYAAVGSALFGSTDPIGITVDRFRFGPAN